MKKSSEIARKIYGINKQLKVARETVHQIIKDLRLSQVFDVNISELYKKYGIDDLNNTRRILREQLIVELNREMNVGDGATIRLWTDRHACTVIKRTAKTITVQRDTAIRNPNWKPEWVPGGFSAICTNCEDQDWTYERNESGQVSTFYWSEKFGGWKNGDITLCRGRHEYYDYNF